MSPTFGRYGGATGLQQLRRLAGAEAKRPKHGQMRDKAAPVLSNLV
jgi:hypothetical protein